MDSAQDQLMPSPEIEKNSDKEPKSPEDSDKLPESQIKDCVHGYMEFFDYIRVFIDTPQFKRLKNLKQLGTAYHVWPGASHNRFEHCLGVAHLANKQVEHLRKYQPSLQISERDVQCVTLAGLLHDLGHGPYSHVWDGEFIPRVRPEETWAHEEGSEIMIDYMIKDNGIEISVDDCNFIKDLVRGEVYHTKDRFPPEKPFLFQIVANKLNGIDVDKFDYIARDWNSLEGAPRKDPLRLIESARVIDGQICYNHKDWITVYQMFHERWKLHKQFYNHKTSKAIELMIVDALKSADKVLDISSCIRDPARFTYLSDDIVQEINRSSNPELKEAQAILRRIDRRELYRQVDFNCLSWGCEKVVREQITAKRIAEIAKDVLKTPHEQCPSEDDIIVSVVKIHFGYGKENPMDQVKFYSKRNPNVARPADPFSGSHLLPMAFGELLLSIFTKDNSKIGSIQAAYRKLLSIVEIDLHESPPTPTIAASEPTSPRLRQLTPSSKNTSFVSSGTEAKTFAGDNEFSSVPQDYAPPSPTRSVKKRERASFSPFQSVDGDVYTTPIKKRRI